MENIRRWRVYLIMFEDMIRKEIITELKKLVKKVENYEEDSDLYCEVMRNIILNSYSEN